MSSKANSQQLKLLHSKLTEKKTQEIIADKLGYSQSYISMILNGRRKPKNLGDILSKIDGLLNSQFSKN